MVTASNVDRTFAGNPVAYLVGPMQSLDTPDRLRAKLANIAQEGPANRIGLAPDKNSRRWRFDPKCEAIAITTGPAPDMADPAVALTRLDSQASDVPSVPLHIHIATPWLFVKFDHGLGGGRLVTELIAAIGSNGVGFVHPIPDAVCAYPGLRATLCTLRRSPVRLLRNLDEVNRRQHHSTTLGSTDGVVSIAYARSGPGFLDRLRRARDQSCPGVSLTALITSQFLRYLSAENVHIEDVVSFIVDLSRHLPSGVGTLGNFVGTAPVHVAPPYSAETVTASLDEYTRGGRSLVRFGLGYAATLINGPPANVLYKGDNSLARVVISDHANTTAAHKIAWAESPDGHIFVRKAPVGYTNQITLAINRVESELHLTASHYGSVMDASTLQRVLDKMTNNDNLSRTR